MREICQSGSEGGGVGTTGAPYPYHGCAARSKKTVDAGLRRHDAEGGGRASIIMLPGMTYFSRWLFPLRRNSTLAKLDTDTRWLTRGCSPHVIARSEVGRAARARLSAARPRLLRRFAPRNDMGSAAAYVGHSAGW